MLLISAYLLIAFISFLFYGGADQSKFDLKGSDFIFDSSIRVQNKAGKTGAYLSEIIMNRGFGLASFIFIYLLIITGFKILGRNLVKYSRNLIFSLMMVVWLSVTLGLIFSKTTAGSFMYEGGRYGFVVSNWLSSLIGKSGLILLLLITGFTLFIIRFEKSYSILKNMFRNKPKSETEQAETKENAEQPEELSDPVISKVIDDNDVVMAVFDPDVEIEEKPERRKTEKNGRC